ncbi:RidA family protein [Streptomyces sp. NPDC054796]
MSSLTHITAPSGVAPGNGYSHVVWGEGRFVAVSGQVALDGNGELVGPGDPAAQARQVFENLRRCLAEAGATFEDVVKLTFYTTDVGILPAIREARDAHIDTARPPASTAVQVAALFRPDLLLEVEAFALVSGGEGRGEGRGGERPGA